MKKNNVWLILTVGILLLVVVDRVYVLNLPSYPAYEESHNGEKSEAKEYKTNSPLLALAADIEEFIDAHEKSFIVLATIALAWFTFTLWRATDGLFVMARKQAADMRESLDIAKQSADAAKKSAEVAEKTLVSTQRAFVFMQKFNSSFIYENGMVHHLVLYPIWENSGVTPARRVKTWTGFIFTDTKQTIDDINIDDSAKVPVAPAVIGPKITMPGAIVIIPIGEAVTAWRKERRLFLWALTEYEDIFDEIRHTQVSTEVIFPENPSTVTAASVSDNTMHFKIEGTRYNTFK